jgi:ABC-type uncharacterized transport system involved in gliding motility auxiliary subunit
MVNYLSYNHYRRADWSRQKYYTLSDKTKGLLGGLTNRIDVMVFLSPQSGVYDEVRNLLRQYEYECPQIEVEWVDPNRNLARTEELSRKYEIDPHADGLIVFDHAGRTKFVDEGDVMLRDVSMAQLSEGLQDVAFQGERVFSSAIQSITAAERLVVYFLAGHGERDIKSFDRGVGYSDIAKEIDRDYVEVKTLKLGEADGIPEDAAALIVAGPQRKLFQPEVDVIRRYLEESGRMIALLDAAVDTGLEPLLEEWGVRVRNDVVMDGTRTLTGRELFITDYGAHPVVRGLRGMTTVMYLPRSIAPLAAVENDVGEADRPQVTELARSSPAGWAESNFEATPMKFEPGQDEPGPVPVAVAVERGPGKAIDVEIKPTRLVVIGDSDFLTNGAASGGNMDLFMSSLNWLLEREDLMAIAPKPIEGMRLMLDQRQLTRLFWVVVAGLPGLVAVMGFVVWVRRRA